MSREGEAFDAGWAAAADWLNTSIFTRAPRGAVAAMQAARDEWLAAPEGGGLGLREAVAGCRNRQAALRDVAAAARKRDDAARHQGWVAALDWVLAEIDGRTAAPTGDGTRVGTP